MRAYFITKKLLIKSAIICSFIILLLIIIVYYKNVVFDVFNSNKQIPIYCVDTTEKKVAITFDCAWGGDDIKDITDLLSKFEAKATFFLVGDWIDKYPDNVKLLSTLGHEIANHSDKHNDMTKLNQQKIIEDIQNANKKIEALTGKKNTLFRAPYGAYNNTLMIAAKSINQYVIQWDIDSLDWKDMGVDSIVSRIDKRVKNGSIILFHNDTKYTLGALPTVLQNLKDKEYKLITVSELIYPENYYIDNTGMQHNLIKESSSID